MCDVVQSKLPIPENMSALGPYLNCVCVWGGEIWEVDDSCPGLPCFMQPGCVSNLLFCFQEMTAVEDSCPGLPCFMQPGCVSNLLFCFQETTAVDDSCPGLPCFMQPGCVSNL